MRERYPPSQNGPSGTPVRGRGSRVVFQMRPSNSAFFAANSSSVRAPWSRSAASFAICSVTSGCAAVRPGELRKLFDHAGGDGGIGAAAGGGAAVAIWQSLSRIARCWKSLSGSWIRDCFPSTQSTRTVCGAPIAKSTAEPTAAEAALPAAPGRAARVNRLTDLADGTCSAAARLGDDLLPRGDCVGSEVWRSLEAEVEGKLTLPIGADRRVHEVTADYFPVEHHAGRVVVRARASRTRRCLRYGAEETTAPPLSSCAQGSQNAGSAARPGGAQNRRSGAHRCAVMASLDQDVVLW